MVVVLSGRLCWMLVTYMPYGMVLLPLVVAAISDGSYGASHL